MKKHAALVALVGLLAFQTAFSQSNVHLKLSDGMPKPGERISLSYDSTRTVLAGKRITCEIHFLDRKDFPVDEVTLKPDDGLLKGMFTVPVTALAFFVRMSGPDTLMDSNGQKGYLYLVYKGSKPVEGAYAAEGNLLANARGQGIAKIKTDKVAALKLYKKEFELYPKNDKDILDFAALLNASKDQADVAEAKQMMAALAETGIEKNMVTARTFYMNNRMWGVGDSLAAVIKARFPDGILTENMAATAVEFERDPAKKELLYQAYIKNYPETVENKPKLETMRFQLAVAYLDKGDLVSYHRFEGLLLDKTALAPKLNTIALDWAQKGERLNDAATLSKQSVELAGEKINSGPGPNISPSSQKRINQRNYDTYSDTYAFILYKQGKFDEALKTEQPLFDGKNPSGYEITDHYVAILMATGNNKKAMALIETAITNNNGSAGLTDALKEAYIKEKGAADGYDAYFAALKNAADKKLRVQLAKRMITQAAPDFTLKDLDGNTVSLAQFKGKILVVDFFTVPCYLCNVPLPGMQLAINKFKDNPDISFIFVDAWATSSSYVGIVKKFIADNKFTFHVLMDEKGNDGSPSKAGSAFQVSAVPALIVIDANGNIKFKKVGYGSGPAEAVANEVSAMIDMALHPEAVISGFKVP